MNSDTPRTDKALFRVAKEFGDLTRVPLSEPVAPADFARQLERDNARLREALSFCITLMDEASRRESFKNLTDIELGKLWLTTLNGARALLAELEAKP